MIFIRIKNLVHNCSILLVFAFDIVSTSPRYLRISRKIHRDLLNKFELGKHSITKMKLGSFLIPLIFAGEFSRYKNIKPQDNEIKALVYMSMLTTPFDNLFDEDEIPTDTLENITNLDARNFSNDSEKIVHILLENIINKLPNDRVNQFKQNFKQLNQSQVLSIKQKNKKITLKELEDITYKKGGYFIITLSQILSKEITNQEKKFLIDLGGWIQITDDISDSWNDKQKGINTLATNASHYVDLLMLFDRAKEKAVKSIDNIKNNFNKKYNIIFRFNILLILWLEIYYRTIELKTIGIRFKIFRYPIVLFYCFLKIILLTLTFRFP